jgi:hypothetical protein
MHRFLQYIFSLSENTGVCYRKINVLLLMNDHPCMSCQVEVQ